MRQRQLIKGCKLAGFQVTSSSFIAVLVLLFSMFAVSSLAHATVTEQITVNYYSVSVPAHGSLSRSMGIAFPIKTKSPAGGLTERRIKWSFGPVYIEKGMCRISSVDITLELTVTLPKLEEAEPAVRKEFDAYLPKLKAHEDGHVQFARDAANSLDQAFAAYSGPCAAIAADVKKMGDKFFEDLNEVNRKYDEINYDLDKQFPTPQVAEPTEQEISTACGAYRSNPQSYAACVDRQEKLARLKATKAKQ
jgi:predicted secreted Zn-dependent protease